MPKPRTNSLIIAMLTVLLYGCQSSGISSIQVQEQAHPSVSEHPISSSEPNVQAVSLTPMPTPSPEKPEPTSPPTETPTIRQEMPIDIVYAGDAMFDLSVKEAVAAKGADFPFVHVKDEVMAADYAFVNLETAVTLEKDLDKNQIYNFKSNPESLAGLKNAGFDMVSVANNHSMDYLQKGFLDTLDNLDKAELLYVGGGKNSKEAYAAKSVDIKEKKIKFLAFSRFIPTGDWFAGADKPGIAQAYDRKPVLDAIERERKDADYVLVYIHWGVEMNNRPEVWQREFARQMIDAGADAIVGSHVHVLQGFEYYKGKPIAYSIGNFLFPDYVRGPKADTGLLHLKLDGERIEMSFQPFAIEKNQIVPKGDEYVAKQHKYLQSISFGVTLEGALVKAQP
ncbi:CapA family protein [Paenibacillus sp. MBLB4367]|uniref:CapA family protein n=1 Tax=Paenibacillus sp. MBLB4367 TaxID=3384767 RepID=UPI0039080EE0